MARLETAPYSAQNTRWPASGRVVLAAYDAQEVVVYQAFRPAIAEYALEHQRFGGPFRLTRTSWIKPNFLWMMYRSDWARREGQEYILAVHLERSFFEAVLAAAVPSHRPRDDAFGDTDAWRAALHASDCVLQWDPDHAPDGAPLPRRAIQLGLRGALLREYAEEACRRIEDATPLARAGREALARGDDPRTPREQPYPVTDAAVASRLGLPAAVPPPLARAPAQGPTR